MSPSGDQLILKLLAQNMAKQGFEKKRKNEVDVGCSAKKTKFVEVTKEMGLIEAYEEPGVAQEVVRNLREKFYRHASENCPEHASDSLLKSLVFNHLMEVSPNLAAEFATSHQFTRSSVKLQKVLQLYTQKGSRKETKGVGGKSGKVKKQKANREVGWTSKRFTTEEDEIIRAAMNEAGTHGKKVDCTALGRQLNRNGGSVHTRVTTLERTGGEKVKRTYFSLVEDQVLLETLIIPRLRSEKLSEVLMLGSHCAELAKQWKKPPQTLISYWRGIMQPTLLKHYAGTLNLRVERMLANHITENYTEFSEICWNEIAAKNDFAGNTEGSLKKIYSRLSGHARTKLDVENSQLTPWHVAQYCDEVHGEGGQGGRLSAKKVQRQKDVIDFFCSKVAELGIMNFL